MISLRVRTREQAAVEARQGVIEPVIELPEVDVSGNLQLQKVLTETGMGGLQMPYAHAGDPLSEAMRRMHSLGRRAVVVHYADDEYRLSMNRSVMDARKMGVEFCLDLHRFPDAPVALFPFKPVAGRFDFRQLSRDWFDRFSTEYALLFEPGALDLSAYLLTRTDELAQAILDAEEICECLQGHPYYQPPPVHGTSCRHDGTPVSCL